MWKEKTKEELWETGTVAAVISLDLYKSLTLTHAFIEEGLSMRLKSFRGKILYIFISWQEETQNPKVPNFSTNWRVKK